MLSQYTIKIPTNSNPNSRFLKRKFNFRSTELNSILQICLKSYRISGRCYIFVSKFFCQNIYEIKDNQSWYTILGLNPLFVITFFLIGVSNFLINVCWVDEYKYEIRFYQGAVNSAHSYCVPCARIILQTLLMFKIN